ncbi:hypothetical protein GF385_01295 [Candidatus Dependentiae bacterium]|nr:hypothetical protein [Candidatus Dependentiae bacterium]
MNFYLIDEVIDKIVPIDLDAGKQIGNLAKIKNYLSQAKVAAIILGAILVAILIALIVLIFKKRKK